MVIETLISRTRSLSISSQPPSLAESFTSSSSTTSSSEREPTFLPDEVVLQIIAYLPDSRDRREWRLAQTTLHAACLVSWQWYNVAISRLYNRPFLYGNNFEKFVKTICPSLNAHVRKSDLAGLVHELNMSALVHQGSKSTTARLLGRTKAQLHSYVAPQANFGINCLAALSKCTALRDLDLSLVSEAMTYKELSNTLRNLKHLHTLAWPRSAGKFSTPETLVRMEWPPKLANLRLSGDLYALMWNDVNPQDGRPTNLPPGLTNLTIQHCALDLHSVKLLLTLAGPQLKQLSITDMTRFPSRQPSALDEILELCPDLESLAISHTYLSDGFALDESPAILSYTLTHPLRRLKILDVGADGFDDRIGASDLEIWFTDGAFPFMEKIEVHCCPGYYPGDEERKDWIMAETLLKANAEKMGRETEGVSVDLFKAF
ncbi:putative f-box domain protein [Venturia nashicola]|nr:putative f-box domain protein [Venturia nashicola]